ncbi:MAG: cyclic nucleotide-binding domain-containing protein [Betaproteobacteria bacterium]|nr:cyclic nucleotide-binding domain-containing protein [Betaproteobacteria bacterium]
MFGLFRTAKTTPRLECLHQLSLFVNLTPGELQIVDDLLHERRLMKDEVIFDEGEEGQAIYIIIQGQVVICRQGEQEHGRIATLEAGTFFGDLALLDNSPRSAQARAATDATLAVFFRADFMSLLETHALIASKISLQLARHLGLRLREANQGAQSGQHL